MPDSDTTRTARQRAVRTAFKLAALGMASIVALLVETSCAKSTPAEDWIAPSFIGVDDGGTPSGLCIDTQCPDPLATCPGSVPCTINLHDDVSNCGACGVNCPASSPHGDYLCSEGQCVVACRPSFADCNRSPADGCETPTENDPANCGFCGNTCKENELCWRGACGCPSGFTQCGDQCVQLDSDMNNCGACGTVCEAPSSNADERWTCGGGVTPPNAAWVCGAASCKLSCKGGFDDCNDDFCGDGCEINVNTNAANCGSCGHACTGSQSCSHGVCLCPEGTTKCDGFGLESPSCVDLDRDPLNCGACGNECPGPSNASGSPACENGKCTYTCFPGFTNCDGRVGNGCEVETDSDPKNCGACKTRCNVDAGQPCVHGQCLTKTCDPIEVVH